ncbi:MAG: M18 family aminopeptidase [Planctomycetota bacterium]
MHVTAPLEAHDLLHFIDASPTPYHAVAEVARRLEGAGFVRWNEEDAWQPDAGTKAYVVRGGGSIVAFHVGSQAPADSGFHAIGAHTDSPNLRLKPRPDRVAEGLRLLDVATYGGVLLHTWFDRDCSLAGRVVVRDGDERRVLLVDLERPLLRVADLAIHLQRDIRAEGFKPNPQTHIAPILGDAGAPDLLGLLRPALAEQGIGDLSARDLLGHDLMLYDTCPSTLSGPDEEMIHAPRLDNLASCHAAIRALTAGEGRAAAFTRVVALWDHEEVGSRSATGAEGTFLADVLTRLSGDEISLRRAIARSLLVSADMAHAAHPNHPEKHDPLHRPHLGRGPVVKVNADQRYATDALSAAQFRHLAADVGVTTQDFAVRNDMPCGSTIGPISASRLGLSTVDVGNPMLSMHSAREMASALDVGPMIRVMRRWLET